jgi:transcriptional regulator with XRE-family HTH domain
LPIFDKSLTAKRLLANRQCQNKIDTTLANQFGEKIKQLRKANRLLQRQVAVQMEIDTPMLSKIERGERKAKKEQVLHFAKILNGGKDELLTLWLADQVVEVVQDEDLALRAMQVAEEEVKSNSRKKR